MSDFTRELAEQIRAESERTKDDPFPPGTRFTRPNAGRTRPAVRSVDRWHLKTAEDIRDGFWRAVDWVLYG